MQGKTQAMNSTHYSAAWTDSGFFFDCSHKHKTIAKADSCIPCAGGYVVAVENGVMRCLTTEEEGEFQRMHYASRTAKPTLAVGAPAGTDVNDSHLTMTILRFVIVWI